MNKKSNGQDRLRKAAEEQLVRAPGPKVPAARDLLHELQVHQIELEMQNEELRGAQIALEESRDRYMELYDFAPVGYLTLSRKDMIDEINLTGAALLGADRGKLAHRRFAPFIARADRDRWDRHFLDVLESDGIKTCELAILRGNGSSFYAQLDCQRQMQADRTFVVRVILTDITARKQAEAELSIGATAFALQESMIITDPEGVILRVNQAFVDSTGYAAEEVIGKTPRMLKSGRHNADFYREMWKTILHTGAWRGEIWDRRKNGEIYPKWLTISAVKDSDGATTHYVGSYIDITERLSAEKEIRDLAFFDPLTRLPNRRLLLDRMKQALVASARSGRQGAVLFVDLDNFKSLNDTLGHDIGDLLLQMVAQRLESCLREGDTVARLGGDEFVVILTDLNEQALEAAAQTEAVGSKILAALNQPYHLAKFIHHSTSSIGATLFNDVKQGEEELLKQADIAMYQAKKGGRNNLRFFDPGMQVLLSARVALESDLRHSISEQQFLLYYQPQVDSSGRWIGAEALIRWRHPDRGIVSPAEFISLCEDTGLIQPLGYWVLTTAFQQLAAWATRPGTAHLALAVNVSVKQFNLPTFVEEVLALIDHFGVNPEKLKLEITESLLLDNATDVIAKMTELKAWGIDFSLDDFGTGYSSLAHLKRLPLCQLKIDQSFVRDVLTDTHDAAISKMIITLAQSMNIGVIAEGVETKAQHEFLARSGCQAFQGYLFSEPVPIDEFEALLERSHS